MHYMPVNQRIRKALLNPAWVCFTWLGMTIGVSLIATPMRFAAESITMPVAFAALNKAELLTLVLLLILVRVSGRSRDLWAWCGALALILVAQGAWLIPELAGRTDIILAGSGPPPSRAHAIYSTLELAKMAALLFLGARSLAERA
jgi:hypothetical protein